MMVDDELSHPCHPPSSFPIFSSLLPYHHSFNPVSNLFSGAFVRKFLLEIFSSHTPNWHFGKKRNGSALPWHKMLANKCFSMRKEIQKIKFLENIKCAKILAKIRNCLNKSPWVKKRTCIWSSQRTHLPKQKHLLYFPLYNGATANRECAFM